MIKRIFFIYMLLSVFPLFGIQFEDTIVKKSIEKESSTHRLRLYMHMLYKESELYDFLGEPQTKKVVKYKNFNSSDFLEIIYSDLCLLYIGRNGLWELFKVEFSSDRFSLFNNITIGMEYGEIYNILGHSYNQKVIEPGKIKHSYYWEDQISKHSAHVLELSLFYSQWGPNVVLESIVVELFAPSI